MNFIQRKILKQQKQKGFSLLELILVLGISSLAFIGFIAYQQRQSEALRDTAAGQQFAEVGQAFSTYIVRENSLISSALAVNGSVTLPITVLEGTAYGSYPGLQLLPTTFSSTSIFGTGYSLVVKKNSSSVLVGLVLTSTAVKDAAGNVRYDWIGAAMKAMGAQSGMTFLNQATTLSGFNAGWTLTNADFAQISQVGLMGYRVQYQGNYDDVYLRLDGTYPMVGDLNMGNYNIDNATDVNFNGWLNGNNALLNNIKSGYIYNTGNITNAGDVQTFTAHGSGTGNYATFDTLIANGTNGNVWAQGSTTVGGNVYTDNVEHYNQTTGASGKLYLNKTGQGDVMVGSDGAHGNIDVRDIFLNTPASANATGRGAVKDFLSNRLSRYVLRGSYYMGSGATVGKPTCTAGTAPDGTVAAAGTPKILVIPQQQWVQTKVEGTIYLGQDTNGIYLYQDQYTIGSIFDYAVDYGTYWGIYLYTTAYNGGYNSGNAVVQTYCDYTN